MIAYRALVRLKRLPQLPVIILTLAFFIWNAFMVRGFIGAGSLREFLNLMIPLGCLTIGGTMVLITGGLDLSVGAVVCLVNVICVTLLGKGYNYSLPVAIGVAVAAAVGIGVLNGIAVGYLRINALLATFATQSIAQGFALWVMPRPGGKGSMVLVSWFKKGWVLGIIPSCALFILIPLLAWYLIRSTPFGIWLYAVGRDEQKAFASGIRTRMVKLLAYAFSGFMAGVASIALLGNIVGGDPNVGMSLTLSALASIVIGGVSLSGGEGDALGALLGAVFFNLIIYTVFGANLSVFYQDLATGMIILLGVIGMTLYRSHRKKLDTAESAKSPN